MPAVEPKEFSRLLHRVLQRAKSVLHLNLRVEYGQSRNGYTRLQQEQSNPGLVFMFYLSRDSIPLPLAHQQPSETRG